MFSFKFHKQLQQLFPLMQQGDEYQTSNKHTSYDQQGQQCNTPNYNTVQQQMNRYQIQNKQIKEQNNQSNLQYSTQFDNNAYQIMRQNPKIDYSQIFRQYNFHIIAEQVQQNNLNTQQLKRQGSIKTIQNKNIISKNNIKKLTFQDQSIHNVQQNEKKISPNQFFLRKNISSVKSLVFDKNQFDEQHESENIFINDKPLTFNMIQNDNQLKWTLIEEIIQLYKEQQIQNFKLKYKQLGKRTHSFYEDQNKGQIQTGVMIGSQFQIADQEKIQKQIINDLKEQFNLIQNLVNDFNSNFNHKNQKLETQLNKTEDIIEKQMKNVLDQRERKENFIQYKYQKKYQYNIIEFQKNLGSQYHKIQSLIDKKIQQQNYQLLKYKRIRTLNLEQLQLTIRQECSLINKELQKQQNQNSEYLLALTEQFKSQLSQIQHTIISKKMMIRQKQFQIQQKLSCLSSNLQNLLDNEIAQGQQIENSLIKLVEDLLKNV